MANIRTVFLGYQDFTENIDAELSIQFKRKIEMPNEIKSNRIEISLKNIDPNLNSDEMSINIDLKTAIRLSKVLRIEISKLMEEEKT